MLSDLARIISKLLIMKALQSFGFGGPMLELGGILPGQVESTVPTRSFARGGIARGPTLALFGEGSASKGEAFVPLPDGNRIPVGWVGDGPGGGNVASFTIYAMDSRDVQQALFEQQGTLRTIFTNQAQTRHGMRQVIRRAAG
jgi:hypothetical protein